MSYEDDCNEYYFGIPFKKRVSKVEAEPKFKVGDRVRANCGYSFDPSTGTVCEVEDHSYGVRLDPQPGQHSTDVWSYCAEDLQPLPVPPFAAGDRVKLNRHFGPHACGDHGNVRELITKAGFVNVGVAMDPWGVYTMFPVEVLEKVGEPTRDNLQQRVAGGRTSINAARVELGLPIILDLQPAIVARVVDGQPRPSNIPYMHASSADAMTEAERLAKNNPGQEFAVYQRVGARVAEVSYNMKEVA